MADTPDVTQYLLASSPEEQDAIAENTASRLQSKALRLREVIESLQESLFSDDAVKRAKTVQFLAAVLARAGPSTLHRTDINLLVTFLVKRFENDPAGIKEATQALRELRSMKHFDPETAVLIPQHIFQFLGDEFPSQGATTRLEVYKLLDLLLDKDRDQMRSMRGEYIQGFLALCAREGDPRNLMICFSMIQVILSEWDLEDVKQYSSDLWDTVSRYFPITFKAKPGDPIKITADDLKERLRACISATDIFSPFAFKFLTKKLDTQTLANVKKDVMRTITACVRSYSPTVIASEYTDIWENLKYEVISATDDDLANEAIDALRAVAARLSFGLTIDIVGDTPLFRYINMIIMECSRNIFEKGQKIARPSGQILAGISAASPLSYHVLVRSFLPLLIAAYEKDDSTIIERKTLLEVVNLLLEVDLEAIPRTISEGSPMELDSDPHRKVSSDENIELKSLSDFADSLGGLLVGALNGAPRSEISYRITALQCLRRLVTIPGLLSSSEAGLYIGYFTQCILEPDRIDDQVRNEAIEALQQCAPLHFRQILESTFPALLGTIPDVLKNDDDGKSALSVLEALGKISSKGDLFETFSRRLLNKFNVVIRNNSSLKFAHIILAGLLFGIQQREIAAGAKSETSDSETAQRIRDFEQYQILVKALFRDVTQVKEHPSSINSRYIGLRQLQTAAGVEYADDIVLELVGKIAMTAIRSMQLDGQAWAASEVFTLFAQGKDVFAVPPEELQTNGSNQYVDGILATQLSLDDAAADQKRILTLSMYLLAGLRRENHLNFDVHKVCSRIITGFETSKETLPLTQISLTYIVALLSNKWNATSPKDQGHNSEVVLPQDLLEHLIRKLGETPISSTKETLELATVFIKAVNFKGDRSVSKLLAIFLEGLTSKTLGSEFASYFRHLLSPSDILCKENFAIIRPLHKQRLFGTCVPTIVKEFKTYTDPDIKTNYLVALAGILRYMPSEIVLPEIETLLPLLLQSLETPGNNVKAASIDVLQVAIFESSSAVEGHIQGIIKRLIGTFHNTVDEPSTSSAAVRAKALVCMAAIPKHLRLTVVLPYKRMVLQKLGIAVNDVKRKVRTEAVDCQMAWWNLAEPSEEED